MADSLFLLLSLDSKLLTSHRPRLGPTRFGEWLTRAVPPA